MMKIVSESQLLNPFPLARNLVIHNTFSEFSPVSLKKIEIIYHKTYSLLFSGKSPWDPWITFSNI